MLFSLGIIFIVALIFAGIFKRLGLPTLIGMLIAGIIIGPECLDLIDPIFLEISDFLRKVALIIIVLRAGLALDFSVLKQIGKTAILLSIIPALCEIVIITIVAQYILQFDFVNAFLLGTVIAAVSPAVIVPSMLNLMERKFKNSTNIPQLIMTSATVEDVVVITMFFTALSLAQSSEVSVTIPITLIISILLGIICGLLSGYLLKLVFNYLKTTSTIKTIILFVISLFFMTLESNLVGTIKFSGLIAVMTLGITAYNIDKESATTISSKFKEVWVIAEIFLFVLVGAMLNITLALEEIDTAIIIIICGLLFRFLGVFISLLTTKLKLKQKLFVVISFIPKATVQAAVGPIALSVGLASGDIILSIAVTAILITAPIGAILINKLQLKLLN